MIEGIRPPSEYRVKDWGREYLNKHAKSKKIFKLDIDKNKYGVRFEFNSGLSGQNSFIYFFWKKNKLFFTHMYKKNELWIAYAPWHSKKILNLSKFSDIENFHVFFIEEISALDKNLPDLDPIEFEKKCIDKVGMKKIKRERKSEARKKTLIHKELEKCLLWKELVEMVEKEEFSSNTFEYKNIKIKFSSGDNYWKKRDKVYKKIKNLKKGEKIQRKRLNTLIKNASLEKFIKKPLILTPFKTHKKIKKQNQNMDFYQLNHLGTFAIGKNALGNDEIRSHWSKNNDWWFHIIGERGSHVYLKLTKKIGPKKWEEILLIIASALRDYCKLSFEKIPVIYTQVLNLDSVKGVPGKVRYKNEKRIELNYLSLWEERIALIS